jgi:hypothetical protein
MKLKEFEKLIKNKEINFKNHKLKTLKSLYDYIKDKDTIKLYEFEFRKILDLLKYDFSSYNISERLNEIKNIGNSTTKKSMIIRYGREEGTKRYDDKIKKVRYTSSKEFLMGKYNDEELVNDLLKNRCPNNIDILKKKYPEEWENKLNIYMLHYKKANSIDGYIDKYGEEEGRKKWNERIEKRRFYNSIDGYIDKYGEEEGRKKWNDKSKKLSYRQSKQYYIDTYGKELGEILSKENNLYYRLKRKYGEKWFDEFIEKKKKRAKENNIGTKKYYIKKFGEEKGEEMWNTIIEKQRYAHTLKYFVEKYGGEEGLIKYEKRRKRLIDNFMNSKNAVSNISQNLFFEIKKTLNIEDCKFYKHNKEFYIYNDEYLRSFYYDFFFNNKIVEFNGDFWHMNPKFYKEKDINKVINVSAKEIWQYDQLKYNIAKNKGYEILVVWESDYYDNKEDILNKCIKFLNS